MNLETIVVLVALAAALAAWGLWSLAGYVGAVVLRAWRKNPTVTAVALLAVVTLTLYLRYYA